MIRAFLGGSFDPIHLGHLQMANAVMDGLARHGCSAHLVSLLPTAGNPFKHAPTSTHHRLNMLQLATMGTPIGIDECEIHQSPPTYTIDTVRHLSQQYPTDKLIFIIGKDSLVSLPRWKDGFEILDFVDLWVFERCFPTDDNAVIDERLSAYMTDDFVRFLDGQAKIYMDSTPIMDTSSSQIRKFIATQDPIVKDLLPPAVLEYVHRHRPYL